ncbi:MAG: SDR family NAD(P)-dependent oxidoreductase [Planctomycetes bacterium]|nr:SDR family NAD(P)-dependent oxidoreductase [Planctomycetota bacterium]
MKEFFAGKRVLVTGGTGSIGSEIVRRLLACGPETVRVFSRDETKQFLLAQELGERPDLRWLIGDVRDPDRLRRAMRRVHFVFHAAAMKHVPACEYNPFEAVLTNVVGTQNIIHAAIDAGVEKVISVSTDKAVDPSSTMGATKLLAERIVSSAYRFVPEVRLATVRFGNVLGSRGSILPLVTSQVEKGGPVTLTSPEMTRFVMPIEKAAWLVLKACTMAWGGETFILRMPAVRIADLLPVLIEILAPRFGKDPGAIRIETIGKRAGEKIHESLLSEEEAERVESHPQMFVVRPVSSETTSRLAASEYQSGAATPLAPDEIRTLLAESGLA